MLLKQVKGLGIGKTGSGRFLGKTGTGSWEIMYTVLQATVIFTLLKDGLLMQKRTHASSLPVVVSQSALSPDHPIDVICGSLPAKLFPDKLKDGFSRCISFTAGNGSFMTPCEFERRAGRFSSKNWKRTIRYAHIKTHVKLTHTLQFSVKYYYA